MLVASVQISSGTIWKRHREWHFEAARAGNELGRSVEVKIGKGLHALLMPRIVASWAGTLEISGGNHRGLNTSILGDPPAFNVDFGDTLYHRRKNLGIRLTRLCYVIPQAASICVEPH